MLLKVLRTILQSKISLIFLGLFTFIYVVYKVNNLSYDSNRLGDNKNITGIIKSIDDKSITMNDTIVYTDTSNLSLGMKVTCTGTVDLPSVNTNFNLFNYRNFLKSRGITYLMDGNCDVLKKTTSLIYKIKNMMLSRIDNLKSSRYIKAFILGMTDDIEDNINENYRINGISHLFSISGMHITFLIGILSFIKRKYLIVFFLIFYLILLGFPPSMMRAVCFFIILLINKESKLNIKNYLLFLYLTIFMLIFNPYNIYNIGFVYSYVITFFLIIYSDCLDDKNYIINTFKVSVLIFIITIPINIQNNYYLNFITPFLNVLFIPFVSFFLFPLSFVTFIFPIIDPAYNVLCIFMETASNMCSSLAIIYPFHRLNLFCFIGYYIIIIFTMHKIRNNEYKYIVIIFFLLFLHSIYPYFKDEGMILALDVKQGDSTLFLAPNNSLNVLIDTGGYYSSNIVKNITVPTLYSLGIKKLDYLILSHGDYDHAGEAINLLKSIRVEKVLFNKSSINELEDEIISYLDKNNISYEFINEEIITKNNIKLQFLNKGYLKEENDDSLVLMININKYKILLMGDASKKVEKTILEEYNLPEIDILKVGHHGSNTSTGLEFVNKINPKISLISAGKSNIYGHPHQQTLNNLRLSDTYVTSINGAIKIILDDEILVQSVR